MGNKFLKKCHIIQTNVFNSTNAHYLSAITQEEAGGFFGVIAFALGVMTGFLPEFA